MSDKQKKITPAKLEAKLNSTEDMANVSLEELRERRKKYEAKIRGSAVAPPTEEAIEYGKLLRARDEVAKDYSLDGLIKAAFNTRRFTRQFIPYPIELADAKKLFAAIYEKRILERKESVVYDEHNKPIILNMVKYFIGDPSCEWDLNKGIWLWGDVGRGKSELFPCLQLMVNVIEEKLTNAGVPFTSRKFKIESCKSIVLQIAADKSIENLKRFYNGIWCLDDIGAEDNYRLFGNDLNVILDVIVERHKHLQQTGLITHATSNLPPKEERLIARYDERFESRCNEMFNFVFLGGKDKRKL